MTVLAAITKISDSSASPVIVIFIFFIILWNSIYYIKPLSLNNKSQSDTSSSVLRTKVPFDLIDILIINYSNISWNIINIIRIRFLT